MRAAVATLLIGLFALSPLHAQNEPDSGPLFNKRDLYFAGGFVLGTIAMFPLDRALADALQDSTRQANEPIRFSADLVGDFGRTAPFIIGPTMYATGKLLGSERFADLGLHGTEALVVAEVVNRVIKVVAGRARPYRVEDDAPSDFDFMRGWRDKDHQSFVSGHSAAAFAAAAAVVQETEEWWPEWKPVIGTAMFGGASLVALSRIYFDKHWASDVVAGAAVGAFAGWKVVRWNHTSAPDNRVNRWLLGVSIAPGENGRTARLWVAPDPRPSRVIGPEQEAP